MRKKMYLFAILGVIFVLLISGCAGGKYLTTKFQEVDEIPEGKAVVYIYRVKAMGKAVHYSVNVNDTLVSDLHLYYKGYLVYFADPGNNVFWAEISEIRTEVIVDIEEGKTYYIKGRLKAGSAIGRPYMELVDSAEGSKEIQICKLIAN